MRRTLSTVLAVVAALALSGCDSSKTAAPRSPAEAATAAVDNFTALNNLKGFTVGTGVSSVSMPKAYILFDPQCPHCSHLWEAAKPLQAKVRIKWIPVGLLNGLSSTQAAMLIEAADPVAMMAANEAAYAATKRPPTATAEVKAETRKSVEENTAMLRKLNATSVPFIVYRDPVTRELTTAAGVHPTDVLAKMFGVPDAAPASK